MIETPIGRLDGDIIWKEYFAYLPTFVEKEYIWFKSYYEKFILNSLIDYDSGGSYFCWKSVKRTSSRTEYILFGEK